MIKKIALVTLLAAQPAIAKEPIFVSCKFEHLPLMQLILRGGMGADDNTLQVGNDKPVPLHEGSSLMSSTYHGQDYTFWLRLPANVTIAGIGSNSITYYGECISSLSKN